MNGDVKRPFWAWAFSEADGTASFTRIATGFILVFACAWVTAIVIKNRVLPDFNGLSIFVGTLYGLNRASAVAAAVISTNKPTTGALTNGKSPAPIP